MEYFSCCSSHNECIRKGECVKLDFYNAKDFNCTLRNRLENKQVVVPEQGQEMADYQQLQLF